MMRPAVSLIKEGSVLMLSGTPTPESVPLHLKPYWQSWKVIANSDGHLLDQDLRKAGWNFFFIAGVVHGYVLGNGSASTVRRALRRIAAKVKSASFNCIQVTDVTVGRFLGIPYLRVSAYSRHIQKTNMLDSLKQRVSTITEIAWSES